MHLVPVLVLASVPVLVLASVQVPAWPCHYGR